jgi:Fic family protein
MSTAPSPHGEWVEPSDTDVLPEALRGMRAYMPRPLPSDVIVPTETHRVQAMAEHSLGELNESTRRLPRSAMFALCTRLREVQNAAQLSGTSLDLSEVWTTKLLLERAAEGVGRQDEVLEHHEAGRVILAFEHGADRVAGGAVVDGELLGEISGKLTGRDADTTESRFRTRQSWLEGNSPRQVPILTPPPGAMLHSGFAQWSTWVGAPHPSPRIGKIALGHLNLALLDPFEGTGRYLPAIYSSLEMVRSGLLREQVLPLSSWLDEHAGEYHEQIRAVVDGGPIENWIEFFADGVRLQALAQLRLIDELHSLCGKLLDRVKGSPTVQRVVAGLITAPVTSNRALEAMYGMANRTATQVTRQLENAGVLENLGGKSYNKVFVCQSVLDVYTLQTPSPPESDRAVFRPPAN